MTPDDQRYDCIVVGAGLAGLAAAYRLRDKRILVLEASERPGGRIYSLPHDPYWLNLGAHMVGGPGTVVGDLVSELGLDSQPIRGALVGLSMRGRRLLRQRVEAYPFLLPLPLHARWSLVKMGVALKRGTAAIADALEPRPGELPADTRLRVLSINEAVTLSQAMGSLHPEIGALLTAMTERTGGDPAAMSAGYALRSFTNVWTRHSPGRNLVGGSAGLPMAIATRLGDALRCNWRVEAVEPDETGVAVTGIGPERRTTLRARFAIVATPAPVARHILPKIPPETSAALAGIRYGAFLTAAVLTNETGPMPWDGTYAVSTPERSFSVLFNQATTRRGVTPRLSGGSLMLFRGARGAARLLDESDRTIEALFTADLAAEFPEIKETIREVIVQRWPLGAPFCFPGRAALQAALMQPLGPIALAGDYLEFPNMETAAQTGLEAAARAQQWLTGPSHRL